MNNSSTQKTILIIGASRGLGHAMAAEFVTKGWHVIGTVRGKDKTLLHDLSDKNPGRIELPTSSYFCSNRDSRVEL